MADRVPFVNVAGKRQELKAIDRLRILGATIFNSIQGDYDSIINGISKIAFHYNAGDDTHQYSGGLYTNYRIHGAATDTVTFSDREVEYTVACTVQLPDPGIRNMVYYIINSSQDDVLIDPFAGHTIVLKTQERLKRGRTHRLVFDGNADWRIT